MKDKFDIWNEIKQQIHHIGDEDFPRPKARQIWWCAIGQNIGSEQSCDVGYERPVLVLRVFGTMFWGLPITSSDPENKKKDNTTLFYELDDIPYLDYKGRTKMLTGFISFHQLRIMDSRRLKRKLLRLQEPIFAQVRARVMNLI